MSNIMQPTVIVAVSYVEFNNICKEHGWNPIHISYVPKEEAILRTVTYNPLTPNILVSQKYSVHDHLRGRFLEDIYPDLRLMFGEDVINDCGIRDRNWRNRRFEKLR